jgi:hypothetical protein
MDMGLGIEQAARIVLKHRIDQIAGADRIAVLGVAAIHPRLGTFLSTQAIAALTAF